MACALPASVATAAASPAASTPTGPSSSPAASMPGDPSPSPVAAPPTAAPSAGAKAAAPPPTRIVWVDKHTISVGGEYLINPDGFHESMTLENLNYGNNFKVTTKTPAEGKVLAFPDFLYGCSWGVCSPNRKLPVQIKHDGDPGASVSTSGHPAGEYNAAYDIWLELKPDLNGQPHGAEIMIWPRETSNLGSLSGHPEVRIDGSLYWEIEWRASNTHGSWNYVQFRKVSQTNSLRGVHLNDFFRAAEARGWASPNWYIQSITAGFEIWSGGQGLHLSDFWARS